MRPYWELRLEGRRFGEWGAFIGSFVLGGVYLLEALRSRPLDVSDYVLICGWG